MPQANSELGDLFLITNPLYKNTRTQHWFAILCQKLTLPPRIEVFLKERMNLSFRDDSKDKSNFIDSETDESLTEICPSAEVNILCLCHVLMIRQLG